MAEHKKRKSRFRRVVAPALAIGGTAIFIATLPQIVRYAKLETM